MTATARAERLNLTCGCASIPAVQGAFYSPSPVFIGSAHLRQIDEIVAAVHRVTSLPEYQRAVLADAPPLAARVRPRALGVFAGFDFHVTDEGPRLIEINTNAGGAMLNAVAGWRHPECCREGEPGVRVPPGRGELEAAFMDMFRREWRLARADRPLKTIAIVDARPEQQFLYPEFSLFAQLFSAHGIRAFVADAAALQISDGRLRAGGRDIDLVYNRVTDFYFDEPTHLALRQAYEQDAAVITPHPRAHALLAHKRNLVRLTDTAFLRSVGAHEHDVATLLAGVPRTRLVEEDSEIWWRDRKRWFFKPMAGFASRGAYRGDKITRRVFGEVVKGGYVAQQLTPPGERVRDSEGGVQRFKVDVRCYVYDGATQLRVARLYQGQTTNFRTVGGGFSPVIELFDDRPAVSAGRIVQR